MRVQNHIADKWPLVFVKINTASTSRKYSSVVKIIYSIKLDGDNLYLLIKYCRHVPLPPQKKALCLIKMLIPI